MDLAQAADQLYGVGFDEFVAQRTALAKQLRADGERDLAAQVAKLPKPTRAAWLINLLAREQPEAVEQLLDLAALLAEAHRTLSGSELAALTQQRGKVVQQLTRTAVGLGHAHGHNSGESIRQEVTTTLTAALADPSVAALLSRGCLVRATTWSGFGPVTDGAEGLSAIPAEPERPAVAPVVDLGEKRREVESERVRQAIARAEQELRRRTEAVERADRRVADAVAATQTAEARLGEAKQAEQQAHDAVRTARAVLERAEQDHQVATAEAEHCRAGLEQATSHLKRSRDEQAGARQSRAEAEAALAAAKDRRS